MATLLNVKQLRIIAGIVLLAALTGVIYVYPQLLLKSFRLDVLDIGQGDSILITTPDNINILVDGGVGNNVLHALGEELPFFDKRIDLVISTHPDADHLEGLIPVINTYEIGILIRTNTTKDTAVYTAFTEVLKSKNIHDARAAAGDRIFLGSDTTFTILWPPFGYDNEKANEAGIVGQLSYKKYNFLLTADIGADTEESIIRMVKPEYLESEVLKVAHHGSRYSSSQTFLDIVKPRIGLISLGADNKYGHPAADVLERLQNMGAHIFRTDHHGTIKVEVEGGGLVIKPRR